MHRWRLPLLRACSMQFHYRTLARCVSCAFDDLHHKHLQPTVSPPDHRWLFRAFRRLAPQALAASNFTTRTPLPSGFGCFVLFDD
eukprot:5767882-Amphidinium_carterae.1